MIGAALAALAVLPAGARASAYSDVLRVYQTSGSIPACRFSSAQLSAALKGVDTYGQQYFADFTDAVQTALSQRASGVCTPGLAGRFSSAAAASIRTPLPASVTSSTAAGIPAPIVAMAALSILLLSAAGLGALARSFAWEPGWAAAWRHAWAEACYRVGGGFDAIADWWRSGR